MADDTLSATKTVAASAEKVFAVLADPATHAAVDGTGWVCDTVDGTRLTASGQIFRMAMYHPNHPNKNYETVNWVLMFDPPRTISWATGEDGDNGTIKFGGWLWRYDLVPVDDSTTRVTLTYDWSATSEPIRKLIGFPPFDEEHLANSLDHLADLVT